MFGGLRLRLALAFLSIVIVTLVTAGVAFYARLGGYQDDLAATTLRQVAGPIYYNVSLFRPGQAQRVIAGERLKAELDRYLELQQEEGMIVVPVGQDGHIVAADPGDVPEGARDEAFFVAPAPEIGPNFDELPLYRHTTSEGDKLVYVSVPMTRLIRAQPEGIHAVVIALPDTGRRGVFADLLPRLVFAGLVGLGAAIVAVLALGAWIYRPLGKVTRGVQAVASGKYEQRVAIEGPREIRALAEDVNHMADSVEQSQRALREFLANVSHELKTPLTSIRGFSQAMLDGTLDTLDERAHAARVIDQQSRRVLQLVDELLDLSRIESGHQPMQLAPVRVAELLDHARDIFALRANELGMTLEMQAPERAVVRADFDRIEQVLANLIDNALRHTPSGGNIVVSATEGEAWTTITVADSGEGIAAEDLPYVFDRFYRSALQARDTSGNGLGLAIAREIVRAHGGSIVAESPPGGGARFTFTLPRAQVEFPATGPQASARWATNESAG